MEEYEAWIRYHCVRQAMKRTPKKPLQKIIEDAAKMANFALKEPTGEIKEIK